MLCSVSIPVRMKSGPCGLSVEYPRIFPPAPQYPVLWVANDPHKRIKTQPSVKVLCISHQAFEYDIVQLIGSNFISPQLIVFSAFETLCMSMHHHLLAHIYQILVLV